jgi:DNA-binding winged helix-turn-helix (wHTH) protein
MYLQKRFAPTRRGDRSERSRDLDQPSLSAQNTLSRRRILTASAGLAGVAVTGPALAETLADVPPRELGAPLGGHSDRSRYVKISRIPEAGPGIRNVDANDAINSKTPLNKLVGIITPSDLHYERSHSGVPDLDPAKHRLFPDCSKPFFERRIEEAHAASTEVSFGPFRLLPTQFLLVEGDKPVPLGSRALEILIVLLERPGELISKQELMERVWPKVFVGLANLTVHISALRRALRDGRDGNRFIINIPGRGYKFVASVVAARHPTAPLGL